MFIGLTGGIASGKSTVANLFMKYGIPVVDADQIAREVVEPKNEAWVEIVEYFGKSILLPDDHIDRKKLGTIIFQDEEKRKKLNNITHPIIISKLLKQSEELLKEYKHVIADIPLLFESKREVLFHKVIVVYVDRETQLKRLRERDNIDENEATLIIATQMNLEKKREKADIVIYNNQGLAETEQQVLTIIDRLNQENQK